MTGRPPAALVLDAEERAELQSWTRSRTCSQALALRARIVLACEREPGTKAVADRLGVSPDMVRKWRARFAAEGLAGLAERRRPGRPPRVDQAVVTEVLVRLLGPPPAGRRWSTRSMAAAVGVSQATVSRIWRAHRIGPGTAPDPGNGRAPLAGGVRDVVGLFLDPPVRVLAVAADAEAAAPPEPTAASGPARRRAAQARELFAVADAFARVHGHRGGTGGEALRRFADGLERSVPATMTVHLVIDGLEVAAELGDRPRFRHHVVAPGSWLAEVDRLLARNPLQDQENVLGFAASPAGLRAEVRAWCRAPEGPFAWTKSPRSLWRGDHEYRGLINDSDRRTGTRDEAADPVEHAPGTSPGAPRIADRVAELVRDELAGGRFKPGERVKEAPLATRLGVSRGPVREALRVLAEEGMLELLPGRGVAVPPVSAENIIDLYALRAAVGGLLMRRLAMLPRSELEPVGAALAQVRAVARHDDHARIGEADLAFQDEIARAARLPQAGVIFERLSMRLRMFNSALQLDWAEAVDLIAREDAGLFEAIRAADGAEAARRWRVKVERSVRYMVAQLPREHFDPQLWVTLAGKPSPRRG